MLYLYDDARARRFEPFASARPVSEMVAGTALVRHRWLAALGADEARFLAGPRLAKFDEPGAVAAVGTIPTGSIIANTRFVPALPDDQSRAARAAAGCTMWHGGSELAAIRLREPIDAAAFDDGSLALESLHVGTGAIGKLDGWWHDEVWDFIRHLPAQLARDVEQLATRMTAVPVQHGTTIGSYRIAIAADAIVEPHVVLDATAGPIVIGPRSHVRAFTRIVGPCYIGADVQVMGGDIAGCSIGDVCKVRGELSSTIMLGHSNKGHDGFVGHSYLGRWVNLGAGTITSNLKNTYGTVALWTPTGLRDTGMQFLGTMFGDHVKTGIGLRLTTGTVLGCGANVYGNMPPKAVPPFSWGDGTPYGVYQVEKFLVSAERMMSRRHVTLTEQARVHLTALHASRWDATTDD